jgi:hypothetical protein
MSLLKKRQAPRHQVSHLLAAKERVVSALDIHAVPVQLVSNELEPRTV